MVDRPPTSPRLVIDEDGDAIIFDQRHECFVGVHVHVGFRLAHWPVPGATVFHLLGGLAPDPDREEDGVMFAITDDGLRQLIADLTAIAARGGCDG